MHLKFLLHGKGSARAAVDYLVGERDAAGHRREGIEVLRGNPDMVAAVADSLDFERKYRSAVIAWAPEDRPTEEQIKAVLDEFEKSIARRVSDGRMLGLIKAWLEMPVVEEDGEGGRRRTNRARRERKGTPQGAPISPLLSNIYMRRFILGWKVLGYARHFGAEIVNYADDFCVLGKAPAAEMLAVVNRLMERLKLPVNAEKTRCLRCPEESLEFLGYRIGWNYRPTDGGRYIGTRPSEASVQSICRRISAHTGRRYVGRSAEGVVERLNRMMSGWANYFTLGQVRPAYKAVDRHATRRLRQWFWRKHKVKSGKYVQFSNRWLWEKCGLTRLALTTRHLPWAKA